MEQLKERYDDATKAVRSLKLAIDKLVNPKCNEESEEYKTLRDSEVKRFEICVDTLWKYLKLYLEVKKGVIQTSPKPVFRECLRAQIVSDEKDVALAIKMVDARNLATHIYKEEVADLIHAQIADYYVLMTKFLAAAKPID